MSINFEKTLEEFIFSAEKILTNNELSEVRHYYEHDEYEMALEGLLIELIDAGKHPDNFEYARWEELVVHYGLNKESVFDEFIWDKFTQWGTKNT